MAATSPVPAAGSTFIVLSRKDFAPVDPHTIELLRKEPLIRHTPLSSRWKAALWAGHVGFSSTCRYEPNEGVLTSEHEIQNLEAQLK